MDYTTDNILTQNESNKNLLLSTINDLLDTKGFQVTVREQLRDFDKRNDKDRLFNLVKEVLWDELFRQKLTQNMIISVYWYEEDFTQQLDACINHFIVVEILDEYGADSQEYPRVFSEEDEGYSTQEYLEDGPYEALSNEPTTFDKHKELEDQEYFIPNLNEWQFNEQEKEIKNIISLAKEILHEDKELETKCFFYMIDQPKKHKEKNKNVTYGRDLKKLWIEFRKNWDSNFLRFVQESVWSILKNRGALYYGKMDVSDNENYIFNSAFAAIHGDLYRFCGRIIDKIPCYYLDY